MTARFRTIAFMTIALAALLPPDASAQSAQSGAQSAVQTNDRVRPLRPAPLVDVRFDHQDFEFSRPIVRVLHDYTLKEGDTVRHILSVLANVRVEGRVDGDVVVNAGDVTVASKAVIDGSLVVWGGNVTIQPGATVRNSLVVIGGSVDAPPDFSPRGEQVVIGTPGIGNSVRGLIPWLTRGLLWGRLIVPSLRWVWTIVLVTFLIGFVLNLVFGRQVAACADTLTRRPISAFLMGLLVMILTPPILVIVAASVIGLAVVPFAIAAFIAAGIVGKVGVARAIGCAVVSESDEAGKAESARSFVIGAFIVNLAYMVPVIGILTWAMTGVFGLGAATMALTARLRRERPAAPPAAPIEPPPVTPIAPMPPMEPPPYAAPAAPASFVAASAPQELSQVSLPVAEPPPVAAAIPAAPPLVPGGDLTLYPRASVFDRVAAFALDIVLIAIANSFLDFWWRDEGPFFFMVLAYHIGFWAWKGTTLGGIICNVRIVRTNGEPLRFIDALVRGLSSIFSLIALGIGCLWMINDPERQMWHDKIAGTVVVKLPRELVLA